MVAFKVLFKATVNLFMYSLGPPPPSPRWEVPGLDGVRRCGPISASKGRCPTECSVRYSPLMN